MPYKIPEVESHLFNRNIIQLGFRTNAGECANVENKLIKVKSLNFIQHQQDAGNLTGIHAFKIKTIPGKPTKNHHTSIS